MARKRFSRNIIASSDSYKKRSHDSFIKEQHEKNKDMIAKISISIKVAPKYYIKCFGKLIQITEEEAMSTSIEVVVR